jgi:glycosyltransferase involved in cell wall biosynthesis
MHRFSIITPTYNRAKYLPDIYQCLLNQGTIDIEWIIVDDGSSDETKNVVDGFTKNFDIIYIYQKNAGKPSAVNAGVKIADSNITVLLDSDDILLPGVLETVWRYYDEKTKTFKENCSCLTGLCIYENGDIIGDKFPEDYYISDYISCNNRGIKGDKSDFFLTGILKLFPFPVLEGEKFIAESVVWNRMAIQHKFLYINVPFVRKYYLYDGLSSQPLYPNNPRGASLYYNEATLSKFHLTLRIRNLSNYIFYARLANQKHIFIRSKCKKYFIFGLLIYQFQQVKYAFRVGGGGGGIFLKKFTAFKKQKKKKKKNKKGFNPC